MTPLSCSETNSNGPGATYYYDGLGERVVKVTGSTTTVYVYDAFGNLAEEYSPYNVWSKDYTFLNGEAAAIENASANPCGTCYLSRDHLGTVRMVTDPTTNIITRHDYLPFGDEIQAGWVGRSSQFGAGADNISQKFTGQYRDPETLNDDFPARYYTAPLMRFLTPDPAGPAAVDITDPQTWNQYAYVRDNPLSLADPSGMGWQPISVQVCTPVISSIITYAPILNILPPPGQPGSNSTCHFETSWVWVNNSGPGPAPGPGTGAGGGVGPPAAAKNGNPIAKFCLDPSCTMQTSLPDPSGKEQYCAAQVLEKNAPSLGLDAASLALSLVPAAGIARTIAVTVGALAVGAPSTVLTAAQNHQYAQAGATYASTALTNPAAAELARTVGSNTVARALPILGTIVSGLGLGYDALQAYRDYQSCMAHP